MRQGILFLLCLAGCGSGSYHPCRQGTVYITVQLDQDSAFAARVIITARLGQGKTETISHNRSPGTRETLVVELGETYSAGQVISVEVIAEKNGVVTGKGSVEKTLDPGCSTATIRVVGIVNNSDAGQTNDLTAADSALLDAADTDLAGAVLGDQGGGDFAQDAATIDLDVVSTDSASADLLVGMEAYLVDARMPVVDLTTGAKPDMGMPPDLAGVKFDLTGADLTTPPDLTRPPDLVFPPDLAPSCNDKVKNGAETDMDCGGGTCNKCADGKQCAANRDCQSKTCDAVGMLCKKFAGTFAIGSGGPGFGVFDHPTVYSCIEACARKFGGNAAGYGCSTTQADLDLANRKAWVDCWNDRSHCAGDFPGGPTPVSDDYKKASTDGHGFTYWPGACSAIVTDVCSGVGNYCFYK